MKKVITTTEESKGFLGLKLYLLALSIYFICFGYYTSTLDSKNLKQFQEYYFKLSGIFVTYSFTFIGIGFMISCVYDVLSTPVYKLKRLALFDKLVFKFALTIATSSYIIICCILTIFTFKYGLVMNYAYVGTFVLIYFLTRNSPNAQKITNFIINIFITGGCFIGMAAMMLIMIRIYEIISHKMSYFL